MTVTAEMKSSRRLAPGRAGRRRRSLLSIVVGLAATLSGEAVGQREPDRAPNIVLIVVDDLGYGELGSYGGREIPTPHIDTLARRGVRFTNGYVTASFCAPARAALMTGRYQSRYGFERVPIGAENLQPGVGVPIGERMLPGVLRDHGYATALVGKWHLGATAPFHPLRRGFDEFFGFLLEGHYYVPHPWNGTTTWLRRTALPEGGTGRWTSANGRIIWSTHLGHNEPDYNADNPLLRDSQPVTETENLTDAFTREAIDFVQRRREQPFFLYLAYSAVHSPMQADDRWLARFSHITDIHRRIFAAMLAQLDDNIGRLLATLERNGVAENTLIVFLSDNGGATAELTSSNHPLRGGKGDLWEGGVRVPFLISWPQRLPRDATFDAPVSALDVFDTALAASGIATDSLPSRDGVDLLPYLTGQRSGDPHEVLYWRMPMLGHEQAARGTIPAAALRKGPWKIVRPAPTRKNASRWHLFNLDRDIAEAHDLAQTEPARLAELRAVWEEIDRQMPPP